MNAEVIQNGNVIRIVDFTEGEYDQLHSSFRKQIKDWNFKKKHQKWSHGKWDGHFSFIDKYNRIPIGLWFELNSFCKEYGYPLHIKGMDTVINMEFDVNEFKEWADNFFSSSEKKPRDYQINAAIQILKFRRCLSELATSAGKTLVFFIVLAYLKTHSALNKMLLIVPNLSLIVQTYDEIENLATQCSFDIKIQMVHGKTHKNKEDVDIVIGTYQTLVNLDADFFDEYNAVAVDEAHGANCTSIRSVLMKCKNALYRFGMSGSFIIGDDADSFTLQAYLGPLVGKISAKYLIDKGYATKVAIKIIKLNYLEIDTRKKFYQIKDSKKLDGSKLLAIERRFIIHDDRRLNYTCGLILKTTKNSLILFSDKKYGYGKRLYDYLKQHAPDREVFYVDGDTSVELRDEYTHRMNVESGKILVASFGTFSTGISINELHHVFLMESYKSAIRLLQSIGRGMRLAVDKPYVTIYDFVDDFSYGPKLNYCMLHAEERLKLYAEQGHQFTHYDVTL